MLNLFPWFSQTTSPITYFNVTEIFSQKFHFLKRKREDLLKARNMELTLLLVAGGSNMRDHVDYINNDVQTNRVTVRFFFCSKCRKVPTMKTIFRK